MAENKKHLIYFKLFYPFLNPKNSSRSPLILRHAFMKKMLGRGSPYILAIYIQLKTKSISLIYATV